MTLPTSVDTVVIGAGQSGLTLSRYLQRASREHVVVERRAELGGGWRDTARRASAGGAAGSSHRRGIGEQI